MWLSKLNLHIWNSWCLFRIFKILVMWRWRWVPNFIGTYYLNPLLIMVLIATYFKTSLCFLLVQLLVCKRCLLLLSHSLVSIQFRSIKIVTRGIMLKHVKVLNFILIIRVYVSLIVRCLMQSHFMVIQWSGHFLWYSILVMHIRIYILVLLNLYNLFHWRLSSFWRRGSAIFLH